MTSYGFVSWTIGLIKGSGLNHTGLPVSLPDKRFIHEDQQPNGNQYAFSLSASIKRGIQEPSLLFPENVGYQPKSPTQL